MVDAEVWVCVHCKSFGTSDPEMLRQHAMESHPDWYRGVVRAFEPFGERSAPDGVE